MIVYLVMVHVHVFGLTFKQKCLRRSDDAASPSIYTFIRVDVVCTVRT